MSVRTYLTLMAMTTVVAWGGWYLVITTIDPEGAGGLGFTFFYFSLFLSLLGSFSVIGYLVRIWQRRQQRGHVYKVSVAFRQAFLWALAFNIALALQAQRLLSWWLLGLLIATFAIIEFVFVSLQRHHDHDGQSA